jgi:hypothetical protein
MAYAIATLAGRTYILQNATGGATVFIGLLKTTDINTPPANTDTLSTITEASGGGYARQSCVMAAASSQASTGAQVTFTFSGTVTNVPLTGWFMCTVVSGTAGTLIGAVSIAVARSPVNLDVEKVTPTVGD